MSMVINNNVPALQSYNIVNTTSNALQKSIAKLSSGLRINSAADDAAGLAISEKMRSQIKGLDQAVSNAQDGISLIQTAEGALSETHSMLQRMRELSVQAANDTLTQQDRSYIQVEIDELRDEITRVGNTTQFNKKKLLNGDSAALWSSDDLETKAIINGGLRQIDQFGQKKSVEGNYKIKIKADPGQGEVQKSDIFKVKHADVVMNKSLNGTHGIEDVSVHNVPAGNYTLALSEGTQGEAVLTGSYGLGGSQSETETNITFNQLDEPVTKITVQTSDGVTLWETTGADIFKTGDANSTDDDVQQNFFNGGTDGNEVTWPGVLDEIKNAAQQKGYTISGEDITDLTVTTLNAGDAPGLRIIYEGGGTGNGPTSDIQDPTPTTIDPTAIFTVDNGTLGDNASVLFEVTNRDAVNNTVTLKATANILAADGTNSTRTMDDIVLVEGASDAVVLDKLFGAADGPNILLNDGFFSAVSDNAKFVYDFTGDSGTAGVDNAIGVDLTASMDGTWGDKWDGGPLKGQTVTYMLDGTKTGNTSIDFKHFYVNEGNGETTEGTVTLKTNNDFRVEDVGGKLNDMDADPQVVLANFDAAYIGKVAGGDVKLRDLDKFWDSQGVFMLEDAKTITLNQGDGREATVTLYASDTLDEVAAKLNSAVANDLGQGKYVDDSSKFVTFVNGSTRNSESVDGTFLIRSVVPGANGEITLSGDENLINAFSLNKIQSSKESTYTVNVSDAHTGESIATDVKVTGNVLHGVINPNVDVEFSALKGIQATWDNKAKTFQYSSTEQETILHLSDNTTVFQIGANEGEDMGINIGDMRSHALGLDGVNVMSRDRASRSITIIDNAIDKVSTQRARIGAYQNRLEYTVNNLTTASENLTSAESRIRDTDMAKEMMNFTKLNIMLQAGNSMLSQANQQPQNVLSLIR